MGTNQEICRRIFGAKTASRVTHVEIGDAAVLLINANPDRVALEISVPSIIVIVVDVEPTVTINQGMPANRYRDVHLDVRTHGEFVTREFWGITADESVLATIVEVETVGKIPPEWPLSMPYE